MQRWAGNNTTVTFIDELTVCVELRTSPHEVLEKENLARNLDSTSIGKIFHILGIRHRK